MKVFVSIDRREAIKAGNDRFGIVAIEVDLQKLSPSQRQELVYCPIYGKTEAPFITENIFKVEAGEIDFSMPDSIFAIMPVIGALPDQKKIGELLDLRTKMRKEVEKALTQWDKAVAIYRETAVAAFIKGNPLPEEPVVHDDCAGNCYCAYLQRVRPKKKVPEDRYSSDYVSSCRSYIMDDPTYGSTERKVTPYMEAVERFVVDTASGLKEPYEEFCLDIPFSIPQRDPKVKQHIQKLNTEALSLTAKSRAEAETRLGEAIKKKKAQDDEITTWINTYGSEHLKRVCREGYPFHGAYLEERCRLYLNLPREKYYLIIDPPRTFNLGIRVMPSKKILDLVDMIKEKGLDAEAIWLRDAYYRDADGQRIPVNGEAIVVKGCLGIHDLIVGELATCSPQTTRGRR